MSFPIEITLRARPTRLAMADRDRFRVGLTATNRSQDALDPQLHGTRLLVDGQPAPAFDLAIGNGVAPAGWDALPPGATTHPIEWPLGDALFEQPGEYRLLLRLVAADRPAIESSATVIVVTP